MGFKSSQIEVWNFLGGGGPPLGNFPQKISYENIDTFPNDLDRIV